MKDESLRTSFHGDAAGTDAPALRSEMPVVDELCSLLVAHGVKDAVLCPGSRNIPIVGTLSKIPGMRTAAVTDERSAAFFALGIIERTGRPALVCCTSGTALLNFHSAVAEAFYQGLPLIVVSADRPPERIGQMDGQTLPQAGVFRRIVKHSVSLPLVRTKTDLVHANRLVNEALLAATRGTPGPVHINVPLEEPLFGFTKKKGASPRMIRRVSVAQMLAALRLPVEDADAARRLPVGAPDVPADGPSAAREAVAAFRRARRRLAIAGQSGPGPKGAPYVPETRPRAFVLVGEKLANIPADRLGAPSIELALAGRKGKDAALLAPDLLITFGGHMVSKRMKRLVRAHPPARHWHVSPGGELPDLFGALTLVVEGDPAVLLNALEADGADDPVAAAYAAEWRRAAHEGGALGADSADNAGGTLKPADGLRSCFPPAGAFGYSSAGAVGALMAALPRGSTLHLGNSSAVRHAEYFPVPPGVLVRCNRGTSGIDGSLSSAAGAASGDTAPHFLVIGDLSFFYDMNALWNTNPIGNLRVLLLNNEGGGIFHSLKGVPHDTEGRRFISAEHHASAKAWVEDSGWRYLRADDSASLEAGIAALTDVDASGPVLLEVFTDKDEDAAHVASVLEGTGNVGNDGNVENDAKASDDINDRNE